MQIQMCCSCNSHKGRKGSGNSNINFVFWKCWTEASTSALTPDAVHIPSYYLGIQKPLSPDENMQGKKSLVFLFHANPQTPGLSVLFAYPRLLALISAKTSNQTVEETPSVYINGSPSSFEWKNERHMQELAIVCVNAPDILGISKHKLLIPWRLYAVWEDHGNMSKLFSIIISDWHSS